jgi:predicted kinase
MKKPKLYLFVGYPGAGKTTVSKIIQEETGARHIWADVERHKMFSQPSHTEEESQQLYSQLNDETANLLRAGQDVIFDTNFNHMSDRQFLRDIAEKNGADTVVVWVATPYDVAKSRAVHSDVIRNGYDFVMSSDQFDAIAEKLEPPTKDENVIKLDGAEIDRQSVKRLLDL